MNKEFINYELALKLKELGFNKECLAVWDNQTKELFMNDTRELNINQIPSIFTLAPLWQQAFDFFRIEKDLHSLIYDVFNENDKLVWDFDIIDNNSEEEEYDIPLSKTYEEARLKCLTKLIELTK